MRDTSHDNRINLNADERETIGLIVEFSLACLDRELGHPKGVESRTMYFALRLSRAKVRRLQEKLFPTRKEMKDGKRS